MIAQGRGLSNLAWLESWRVAALPVLILRDTRDLLFGPPNLWYTLTG